MAFPSWTITCEDCRHEYATIRRNTKVCGLCRLVRDLPYIADKKATCWICENEFAPLYRGENVCAACGTPSQRHGIGECVYCHESRPRVRNDVSVCDHCARQPDRRRMFMLGLLKKQAQRRETVGATA